MWFLLLRATCYPFQLPVTEYRRLRRGDGPLIEGRVIGTYSSDLKLRLADVGCHANTKPMSGFADLDQFRDGPAFTSGRLFTTYHLRWPRNGGSLDRPVDE